MGLANRKVIQPNEAVLHAEVSLAALTDDGEVVFATFPADVQEIIDFVVVVKTVGVGSQNVQFALRPAGGANVTALTAAINNQTAPVGTIAGPAEGVGPVATLIRGVRLALRAEYAAAITSGQVVEVAVRYRR